MYKPINQANRRGWLAKEIRYTNLFNSLNIGNYSQG